ncbi:MAG: hypothetical protein HC812_05280 [Leptolyngbya sp. RL_3_1]|nr:hypothetical protein [Leptolyngbya sp. RL_3_1]
MTVLSAGAILMAPAARAASFHLDFNTTGFNGSGLTLDAHELDGSGQNISGTDYSTSIGNIGTIWSSLGLNIFGYDNNYIGNETTSNLNNSPLGLFNSNCTFGHAGNGVLDKTRCEQRLRNGNNRWTTYGDNDLATGITTAHDHSTVNILGTVPSGLASPPNLGNLLIFEENKGNAAPDDTASGGTFVFKFDDDKNYAVESLSVVDDAKVKIKYYYKDGSPATTEEAGTVPGENDITFFSGAQQRAISKIAVQFENSGGIGGIRLKEIKTHVPSIPEPTAALGLLAFGAVATRLKRNQRSVSV